MGPARELCYRCHYECQAKWDVIQAMNLAIFMHCGVTYDCPGPGLIVLVTGVIGTAHYGAKLGF